MGRAGRRGRGTVGGPRTQQGVLFNVCPILLLLLRMGEPFTVCRRLSFCPRTPWGAHSTPSLPSPAPPFQERALLFCSRARSSEYRGVTRFLNLLELTLDLEELMPCFPSAGPEGNQRRKRQPRAPWLPGSPWAAGEHRTLLGNLPGWPIDRCLCWSVTWVKMSVVKTVVLSATCRCRRAH